MTRNYDDLAERAERGELAPKPGTARTGQEAAAEARRLLMEATGTDTVEAMYRVALGRPAVGTKGGASPTVRARVPQALKDRVAEVAASQHRKESEVVRDALAAYLTSTHD